MYITPQVDNDNGLNVLIHLGAGLCSELDDYILRKPEQILLVEADPERVHELINRTKSLPNVHVVNAAVSDTVKDAILYRYSLADANSLHKATGLLELFPGLKLLDELPVTTATPESLFSTLNLQEDQKNTLVIDIPGEELSVLKASKEEGYLSFFNQIYLHCGRDTLYEGGEPSRILIEWLKSEGYDPVAENNSQDPDRPVYLFHRNEMYLRYLEVSSKLANIQRENDILETNIAAQTEREQQNDAILRVVTHERDEQAKQVLNTQQALDESVEECNSRTQQLIEVQQALEKSVEERNAQAQFFAELKQLFDDLVREKAEMNDLLSDNEAVIKNLNNSNDELTAKITQQSERLNLVEQESEVARDEVSVIKIQLEKVKSERDEKAGLASRLQSRLDELEPQLLDAQARQVLLNEEMIKTEGQIDLIKDIFLRGDAL